MKRIHQEYYMGNIALTELVEHYGDPLFIYDGDKMVEQYQMLFDAFDVEDLQLNYALKALSNISILRIFQQLGSGIDAVSVNEIRLALKAGFDPHKIVFTPNSVTLEEYLEALALGVRINIDNIPTLEYFGQHHNDVPVGLRIKPGVKAGGNEQISVGHFDSKFGIGIYQLKDIIEIVDKYDMTIDGLHMHTGSDILNIDSFIQAIDVLFETAGSFDHLNYLDFGSGFKVQYKEGDIATDIQTFGQALSERVRSFCQSYGRNITVMFEPGKILVSEAGLFLTKVSVIKESQNTTFACCNTGFNHLIRPMFYDAYHEIINISNPDGPFKPFSIVGYICETDTFAWNREIADIRSGDILAFKNAGAYCFMMASNYNSRLLPAEVLVIDGKHYLIRRRQTFSDLIEHMTDPNINVVQSPALDQK